MEEQEKSYPSYEALTDEESDIPSDDSQGPATEEEDPARRKEFGKCPAETLYERREKRPRANLHLASSQASQGTKNILLIDKLRRLKEHYLQNMTHRLHTLSHP